MTLAKAVFFDRDGVLVRAFPEGETTRGPRTIGEIQCLPDVQESCRKLRCAGYKLVMVTNQPDVARGIITKESVSAVNMEIVYSIPLDAVYTCPHQDGDLCSCRKPLPGLLFAAGYEMEICLRKSFFIGDRQSDMNAAWTAGCLGVFSETNTGIKEAVEWILAHSK